MTTTITITGTGCPIPSATRAGPGVLVRHGDLALQFDAGRGTVMRLTAIGISTLVLTHLVPPPDRPGESMAFAGDIRSGGFTGELIVADDLDEVVLG